MHASLPRRTALLVAGIGFLAAAGIAQAAPLAVTVPLTGAQQVPPVDTKGSGSAAVTYDPATHMLSWSVTFSGLSSEVTMAHFHGPAETGKNAGVRIWISKKGEAVTSPIKGEATLTEADAKDLMAGEMYVNVHTKDHPGGEIRGQVVLPKG